MGGACLLPSLSLTAPTSRPRSHLCPRPVAIISVGIATAGQRGSLKPLRCPPPAPTTQARAARQCMDSKANGALMRAAPLAVWGHRLPPAELAAAAAADVRLSHPNPACADASAAYCIALAHLIAHPGNAGGALAAACAWASEHAGAQLEG